MKIKAGLGQNTTRSVALSNRVVSVVAIRGERSVLITGFEVTVKKRTTYVPVVNGKYMAAWLKVFQLIKPYLK